MININFTQEQLEIINAMIKEGKSSKNGVFSKTIMQNKKKHYVLNPQDLKTISKNLADKTSCELSIALKHGTHIPIRMIDFSQNGNEKTIFAINRLCQTINDFLNA